IEGTDYQPEDSPVSLFDEDRINHMKDMRLEAEAVVNYVLFAVAKMYVEGNCYCLEFTEAGLRVVGYAFDQVDESLSTQYYETVYSLLDYCPSDIFDEVFLAMLLLRRFSMYKQ
uniref:GSKIP domain-containing protein n=1 Tax=Hucho hucho TaxID=62062 RepID=A0A4W5MYS2_9TELE